MSFPDNNERGRGENPLSFLLLFCAILRTEVVKGMLRKMLIYEGIIYVGGVLGLLLIIGSIVMGIVVYILKQNIEYFVFQYPFEGLLCIICIMSFLCVIIPNIFLHKMERNSLIERIKKER